MNIDNNIELISFRIADTNRKCQRDNNDHSINNNLKIIKGLIKIEKRKGSVS